ncbi:MAG TPA: Hsp20/alpha crystallin family protein [Caulobacterales bacterium]|nr:Hsp20/alpha crystallin family protein [Caulobacterales bacterium]
MASRLPAPPDGGGHLTTYSDNPFFALRERMSRLFDNVMTPFDAWSPMMRALGAFLPEFDVAETDDEVRIRADLPGMSAQDIDISLEGGSLVISGERREERSVDRENVHISERSFGAFHRTIYLPQPVDPDTIRAEFDQGVLHVTARKARAGRGGRKIAIKVARGPRASEDKAH